MASTESHCRRLRQHSQDGKEQSAVAVNVHRPTVSGKPRLVISRHGNAVDHRTILPPHPAQTRPRPFLFSLGIVGRVPWFFPRFPRLLIAAGVTEESENEPRKAREA